MVVVGIGGTLWGGQNTYVSLWNRSPVEISCADYLRSRPDAKWLRLTHCVPDFERVGVESSTHTTANGQNGIATTTAVYVPLRAENGSRRTQILLFSDDDDMLSLGSRIAPTVGNQVVRELSTSVEGLVESALDVSRRRREEIADLHLGLGNDFVIFDRGARPRPLWFALGELWLGVAALTLLVRRYRRWSRGTGPSLPRATLARRPAPANDDADESS